jgi:hypothetical protein
MVLLDVVKSLFESFENLKKLSDWDVVVEFPVLLFP